MRRTTHTTRRGKLTHSIAIGIIISSHSQQTRHAKHLILRCTVRVHWRNNTPRHGGRRSCRLHECRSHLQVHPSARRTAFNLNRLLYLFVAQNRAHVLQRLGSQKYIIVLRADAAAWFTYQSGNLLVGTGWGSVAGAYSLDVGARRCCASCIIGGILDQFVPQLTKTQRHSRARSRWRSITERIDLWSKTLHSNSFC